ncbi:tripartite tricarboxylate transporter substrate binding protein [Gelria sp. Kuro-4]|uniref:tripartite tricarboxylate transporter substrate binding protein n=1 Tax=Gelria sp. Kuro-4 TaxID=2796927 RepID=UPI001BEF2B71|nr:tripartite tricarboxylate transporter substrate binding protein [Gelria sp. Kuro-4]BCV25908.1 recombinase RecA [Gelria sp. Kuro-4]
MRRTKLFLTVLVSVLIAALVAGCSSQPTAQEPAGQEKKGETTGEQYPNRPIQLIVSYAAGGGTDVGARLLTPYLEKKLGQPVTVVNVTGGGGWVGWTQLAQAKPDGYTIGYINIPNMIIGYLDPAMKRKDNLESFAPIANHVLDYTVFAVRKDSKFKDIDELMNYAKAHPGELSATSTGIGSDEHISLLELERKAGAKFQMVQTKGFAECLTQVLGGHVDVLLGNVGEVVGPARNGDIRVLAVLSEERSKYLPDVPTLKEKGIDVVSFAARGIAAPAGTPQEVIDKVAEAIQEALENPEHQKKMEELGLALKYMDGDEYQGFLKAQEQRIKDLMGW